MVSEEGKRALNFNDDSSSAEAEAAEPTLDRAIQTRIGDHLRAMYDDLISQPVPDRFAELLGRLDGNRADRNGER